MMNVPVAHTDSEILKGKRILFVEDRPQTLRFFLEALSGVTGDQVHVKKVKTLREAVHDLSESEAPFDMVVIDLHMSGDLPEELKPFETKIQRSLNEGQTLGLWLHEHRQSIPYVYLSSVPDAFRADVGDRPAFDPINKFTEKLRDFPHHLADALRIGTAGLQPQ
jgi:CheY-like chemotaxis protein